MPRGESCSFLGSPEKLGKPWGGPSWIWDPWMEPGWARTPLGVEAELWECLGMLWSLARGWSQSRGCSCSLCCSKDSTELFRLRFPVL